MMDIDGGINDECQLPSPCLIRASDKGGVKATIAFSHMHFSFHNLACLVYPPCHYQWIVKISKGPLFMLFTYNENHSIMPQQILI